MKLKYTSGNIDNLKELLQSVVPIELEWKVINKDSFQVKIVPHRISVNYYSNTGSIQVQGPIDNVKKYEQLINELLQGNQPGGSANEVISETLIQEVDPSTAEEKISLSSRYNDSEIIIGLVGAVGVEYKDVKDVLRNRLINTFNYVVDEVRISSDIIAKLSLYSAPSVPDNYERISNLMQAGNEARKSYKNNEILALGAIREIGRKRVSNEYRKAYIIDSLKHPDEVKALREVYGQGFYLVGVFSDINARTKYLTKELRIKDDKATLLINKDENDQDGGHGQHTSNTYHLADFFIGLDENKEKLKESLWRFLDIIFGHPHITPLFEEYLMFMAFASSLRSADLSRQVGAVLTQQDEIVATGANDVPKFGGGLYWPEFKNNEIVDVPEGRDYTRGEDSNAVEKRHIIDDILQKAGASGIDTRALEDILNQSRLKDLIEFGRVVHAEMEALMMCARNNISTKDGVLYCTTFPCHNCAKHIVAAGVKKVVYIEPYQKSKALDFHSESIKHGSKKEEGDLYTYFEPFVGVGPRRFFDLFSINLGSGRTIKRKDKQGLIVGWEPAESKPKVQLFPISYIYREKEASQIFDDTTREV